MRRNISLIVIIGLLILNFYQVYNFVNDYFANRPYEVPETGSVNYVLKDVRSNKGEWKLLIDNKTEQDGLYIISDVDILCEAKDSFYVVEDNSAYYSGAYYKIILYYNDKVKKYIRVKDGSRIHFGSLEKHLDIKHRICQEHILPKNCFAV